MKDLGEIKKVYFVGIGGIGISAVARMFLLEGKKVSGSDVSESEVTDELRRAGAQIIVGQSADFIPKDADLIVYSIAIPKAEPKFFSDLQKLGKKMLSYPEILGLISKDKFTIAVSGTHGKTTTTAMIAKVMIDAGLDPTVIVGSLLKDSKSNFIAGKSKYLVVEACEYQRSFLNINPTVAVITNIDNDHLDYYKDINDIVSAFGDFVCSAPKEGFVVANIKGENVEGAIRGVDNVVDYDVQSDLGLDLKVPGRHNISNAKVALAVAEILGIKREDAVRSLNGFSGTWRRFEYKGKSKVGAYVYDDYGHHPTEIKATLDGARELFPKNRIVVVFQPHLYSRTKILLQDFSTAFFGADEVILAPIYPAREKPDPSISSEILGGEMRKNNLKTEVKVMGSFGEIEKYLQTSIKKDDVLITLGAGEANKISDNLVRKQ